jgi:hypothetical protein
MVTTWLQLSYSNNCHRKGESSACCAFLNPTVHHLKFSRDAKRVTFRLFGYLEFSWNAA